MVVVYPVAFSSTGTTAPWGGVPLAQLGAASGSAWGEGTGGPGSFSAGQKACLISSLMPLEEKVALWKERIGQHASPSHALAVWREAKSKCEVRNMKEKRALARVILGAVRGIQHRCALVSGLSSEPAVAAYIRRKILASVTSPGDVSDVMLYCDAARYLTRDKLMEVYEKAKTPDARIVALKELIALYPLDMELKLMLLDELEDEGSQERLDEAMRLARELRHAPYANVTIRTRVGEFYMRHEMPDEARRCFSEIVEFSPYQPSARRRLGDIYRNYGWYEDAYRQYETLQSMVPEDESVLILMAEAAALAGRVDEALRLAERVSQSDAGSQTVADIARLFNIIRLANLRVETRAEGDQDKLKELLKRSRRAGVLRDSTDLRVVLKWDHPDVRMKLFAQYEGSEIERAGLVAPHFGCEALAEKESSGSLLVQVVKAEGSVEKETRGTLYVIWYEGTENEVVEVIPVELPGEPKTVGKKVVPVQMAWTLTPPPGKAQETKPVSIERGAIAQ